MHVYESDIFIASKFSPTGTSARITAYQKYEHVPETNGTRSLKMLPRRAAREIILVK